MTNLKANKVSIDGKIMSIEDIAEIIKHFAMN